MTILSISRDWGTEPAIVRIDCDDTLAVALGSTYLTDQADNIKALNNGAFQWNDNDLIALSYSGGNGFFSYDSANNAIVSTQPYGAVFAAQYTTTGGAAAEAITITGAEATDLAFVQMVDNGTSNVTIVDAVMTADTLTVTFSADPVADTIINYQIIRP